MNEDNRIHVGHLSPRDVALLKQIAEETAEKTVKRFATTMGIDPEDPMRAQKNMQWLDRTRELHQGAVGKAIYTAIGIAVLGALQTAWTAAKSVLVASIAPH